MSRLLPLILVVFAVEAAVGDVRSVRGAGLGVSPGVSPGHTLFVEVALQASPKETSSPAPGPTPPAIICVVVLTGIYFAVHSALVLSRMAADSCGLKYSNVASQKILQAASLAVSSAPMLAVLILGCHMHISFLSRQVRSPPEIVRISMIGCTGAVVLMTACVCMAAHFTGSTVGDAEPEFRRFKNPFLVRCSILAQYILVFGLYTGVACVIWGTATFEPPEGTWKADSTPTLCPTLQCVTILVIQFFAVYLLVQVAQTRTQLSGVNGTKFENAILAAAYAIDMSPILGSLFLGVRMHGVHADPDHGYPQRWAQRCIYGSTISLTVLTALSVIIVLVLQGEREVNEDSASDNVTLYKVQHKVLGSFLIGARYAMMICIVFATMHIIGSIFIIESPKGSEHTPPVSIALRCVIHLIVQFLVVHLVIWIYCAVKEVTGKEWLLLTQTMEKVRASVALCSMLAPLFLSIHTRGLQITNNVAGVPQGWIEDGMSIATGSVLIQLLLALVTAMCAGPPQKHTKAPEARVVSPEVLWTGWLGLLFMYLGLITVIIGLHVMTPDVDVSDGREPKLGIPASEYDVSPLHARSARGLGFNILSSF